LLFRLQRQVQKKGDGGEMDKQEGTKATETMDISHGVLPVEETKCGEDELAPANHMTLQELRDALLTFLGQTSQIRPISFEIAINALLDIYCLIALSFQVKEAAAETLRKHCEIMAGIIESGKMGPGTTANAT
jgi:hypothetical protein